MSSHHIACMWGMRRGGAPSACCHGKLNIGDSLPRWNGNTTWARSNKYTQNTFTSALRSEI